MLPPCSELREEGHGEEMGLNLALQDLAHNCWHMTSFRHGKRVSGNLQRGVSYLPFAAMHCGYKSIFPLVTAVHRLFILFISTLVLYSPHFLEAAYKHSLYLLDDF